MQSLLKRLRAVGFMAASWAVAWALLGALFRVIWPSEAGLGTPSLGTILSSGFGWMYPGVLSGAVFALVLVARAPRRIEAISLGRMLLWGAVGGALLPIAFVTVGAAASANAYAWVLPLLPKYVMAGALCGAISLVLARRGPAAGEPTSLPRESFAPEAPVQSASDSVMRIKVAGQTGAQLSVGLN